jgi:hypothetical protein
MIREMEVQIVNLGTCLGSTFHAPEPGDEEQYIKMLEGVRGEIVKILIADTSTCLGGTFHPEAPWPELPTYQVVSDLPDIVLRKVGLANEAILDVFLTELDLACSELGVEHVEVDAGDRVKGKACAFATALGPIGGKITLDFSPIYKNDWDVFGRTRQNIATLIRHELFHIKAADRVVLANPQALGLPDWFNKLTQTPAFEAAAHFLSPRELIERYIQLTVESSVPSFSSFNQEDLRQLVEAVGLIATVWGTVEEYSLNRKPVELLFAASALPRHDSFISYAVALSKSLQREFYAQRKAGRQEVDLRHESLQVFKYWMARWRKTSSQ